MWLVIFLLYCLLLVEHIYIDHIQPWPKANVQVFDGWHESINHWLVIARYWARLHPWCSIWRSIDVFDDLSLFLSLSFYHSCSFALFLFCLFFTSTPTNLVVCQWMSSTDRNLSSTDVFSCGRQAGYHLPPSSIPFWCSWSVISWRW